MGEEANKMNKTDHKIIIIQHYCMAGTVLSTGDIAVNKINNLLHLYRAYIRGHPPLIFQDTHRPVFILDISPLVVLS